MKFKIPWFIFGVLLLAITYSCNEEKEHSFSMPEVSLLIPADSAVDVPLQPTFTWEGSNAMSYDFYFGSSEKNLYMEAEGLESNSFTLSSMVLNKSNTYYWKVIAWSEDGFKETEVRTFTTLAD